MTHSFSFLLVGRNRSLWEPVLETCFPAATKAGAASVEEALEKLDTASFDAILVEGAVLRETLAECASLAGAAAPAYPPVLLVGGPPLDQAQLQGLSDLGVMIVPEPVVPEFLRAQLLFLMRSKQTEARLQQANNLLSQAAEERSLALYGNMQRFDTLFEHCSDFVVLCSDPGPEAGSIILAANPQAVQWSGYSREQLIGRRTLDLFGQQGEEVLHSRLSLLRAQRQIQVPTLMKSANGHLLPMMMLVRIIEAEPRQMLLVAQRRGADDAPLPPRALGSPGVVYELLLQTGEVRLSGAIHTVLNLPANGQGHFSLREWESRIHPQDREDATETRQQATAALGEYQLRYRYEWSSGVYRTLEDVGVVIADEDGRPKRALGTLRDITSTTPLMEEQQGLVRANRLENLGMLASGIAHDFNNILAAIIGLTDLSVRELPQGSELHEDLKEALQAAYRAKELVRQILAFTRQTGQDRGPLHLHVIARETLHLLGASLPPNVILTDAVDRHSGLILGNAIQMHQVTMNFCVNAAQALGPEGGAIEVRVENVSIRPGSKAAAQGVAAGEHVMLSVSDSGAGMSAEVQSRIFQPFFTTKPEGEGTGVGLSLVQQIVAEHEGVIRVESRLGEGSTFRVYFPRVSEAVLQEESSAPAPAVTPGRVLFVDDELTVRKFAEKALRRLGHDTVLCEDGLQALREFQQHPLAFDLLITDQIMPEMRGTELAREVHALRPEVPIILFTGYSQELTQEQMQQTGVLEVLIKPVPMRELGEAIGRALENSTDPA